MDIYSSLFTTLLVSVITVPVLAADSSIKASSSTLPAVQSLPSPSQANLSHLAAVNINTADVETLVFELKGIGEKRARAIVAYREEQGNFKSADELLNIKGISQKVLDQNRAKITV